MKVNKRLREGEVNIERNHRDRGIEWVRLEQVGRTIELKHRWTKVKFNGLCTDLNSDLNWRLEPMND